MTKLRRFKKGPFDNRFRASHLSHRDPQHFTIRPFLTATRPLFIPFRHKVTGKIV
jgi:hypothetical protein